MFNHKKFESQIPASFHDAFKILKARGFIVTLVGGTVRDYLLSGVVGEDWDIELSHPTIAFNKDEWKNLGRDLGQIGRVTFLPYEVIRLESKKFQFEFSPPRKEIFNQDWQGGGHSNFVAEYDFKFSFGEAVKRRDFTINAMGLRFHSTKEIEFIDPMGAAIHLRDKLLHPCGENFKKDPVRFLRAIRFAVKMGFDFTAELKKELELMPLEGLSPSYVWSEMHKSNHPIVVMKKLLDWQQTRPELKLPLDFKIMALKWEDLSRVLSDPTRHETWIIALEWIGVSCEEWRKYFSVSSETAARLSRWAISSKNFIQIKPEVFHGEFETIRELPEFATLFDWYFTTKQLLQKNASLPLLKMIGEFLPDWIHLYRFEPVKDVKHIDPPFRAKYQLWNLCQRL